jgi:uncharacterized protein with GYD domain
MFYSSFSQRACGGVVNATDEYRKACYADSRSNDMHAGPWQALHMRLIITQRVINPSFITRGTTPMSKYLAHVNYIGEGIKGLLKEGGTSRRAAAEKAFASVGGTLESFYYAFGDTDCYVILDMPDHVSAAATALLIASTGTVTVKLTVLLTPEDLDAAAKMTPTYRAPGQ